MHRPAARAAPAWPPRTIAAATAPAGCTADREAIVTDRDTACIDLATALALGPPPPGRLSIPVLGHGTLEVRLYAPHDVDAQVPHARDEAYVVARGRATFVDAAGRIPVGPGSLVFVPAGRAHRFEEIADGFAVWVLFYGPEGGEPGPLRQLAE